MKNFIKHLFLALLCLSSLFAMAQQSDTLEIRRNAKGEISFARFKPEVGGKISDGENFLKKVLHAKPDDEFRLKKETTDPYGITHRRYQQYYKGIKVENGEYLVHGKNGMIGTINGDFKQVNTASVEPSIGEHEALGSALAYVNAKEYKWEDPDIEQFAKRNTHNPNATYYPKGELVIARDALKDKGKLKLAWKFTISSLVPNNEQWVYVDAATGYVIGTTPLVLDVNTTGTAQTMYSGNQGITCDSFTGGFRLRETRNGVDVQTLDLQNSDNYASAIDFTNSSTNWTTGSWADISQDQQALDAHWGAENVLDYWHDVQSRNSIDDNGIRVLSYVHYTPYSNGSGWSNAQWVGGTNNRFMQYGDGDGSTFNPVVALDVCAHEFGHGINEFTANLTPGTQESGALNEGFSDIWAASIEHWAAPNKDTWLVGEEIFSTTYSCIRNLQNPNSSTTAEGQHPDTYHGDFWDYSGEPHTNSTVLSHWFYLLSQGGSGTNDNSDSYSVAGIGIEEAADIAYQAESNYLTSSSDYADARNNTISAAEDIFCENSPEVKAVTDAWYAVGVGAAYSGSLISVSGADLVCISNTNFTINNLPAGAGISWSVSPTSLFAVDNGSGTPFTTRATGSSSSGAGDH